MGKWPKKYGKQPMIIFVVGLLMDQHGMDCEIEKRQRLECFDEEKIFLISSHGFHLLSMHKQQRVHTTKKRQHKNHTYEQNQTTQHTKQVGVGGGVILDPV